MVALIGWGNAMGFLDYGELWRAERRLTHQSFHSTASKKFRPYTLKSAHGFLRRMCKKSDDVVERLCYMAGEAVVSITFGLDLLPENDPYIQMNEDALLPLHIVTIPGKYLIDFLPVLKHVPEWVPGAGFKKQARIWREASDRMFSWPFSVAKEFILKGEHKPSFLSKCLSDMKENDDEDAIRYATGTLYGAGVHTTSTGVASCILGLLARPELMVKAQEDIDAVVPYGELPTFEDEEKLPFITAICMEALRWRVVSPIAIPHVAAVDDVYQGYRIPKGSIIVPNCWAMLNDEKVYPDPFTFKPERFMKDGKISKDIKDPSHAVFGFGRRICPGRFLALSSMWITVASMLAAFDITKAVDESGNVIEPDYEYIPGFVCRPKPLKVSMKPRSRIHEEAIMATEGEDVQFED
ncbi:hypothetical protein AMATHDRAFT_6256 [Amanita thiersii Skay4041]|uniref:Cytochrome P450 n=1 Tax=Amanita thiersii Skay4041 TaxID=703135 RepID=A0A2A9NJR8_9AGAR|nr:hypothetical protein AMATHDRAFT_6256 [Amanita thiersii Skay4041]